MSQKPVSIGITIGGNENQEIYVRLRRGVERSILTGEFVRIAEVIGRVKSISDANDFPSSLDISKKAANILETGKAPTEETSKMLYKKLHVEPLGVVAGDGGVSDYDEGVGYFAPVHRAEDVDVAILYPPSHGIKIGNIISGKRVTNTPFILTDQALMRMLLCTGKNGSGKTNFLKSMLAYNLYDYQTYEEGGAQIPCLVFGHPDLFLPNNSANTEGLSSLADDRVQTFGYDKKIQLNPSELDIDDVVTLFPNMTQSMEDLWRLVASRKPNDYIEIMAGYDINEDALDLVQKTEKDKETKETITTGVALRSTITAVTKQARSLKSMVNPKGKPVISLIVDAMADNKTVLVNTFNLTDWQSTLLIKLVLASLTKIGQKSIYKGKSQRFLVVIDEAAYFLNRLADEITEFVQQCRKFGVTIFFCLQSPADLPMGVYNQIYSTMSFHMNRNDVKVLTENCPPLADSKNIIMRPPLRDNLGIMIVSSLGYPYPAVIKAEKFEEVVAKIKAVKKKRAASAPPPASKTA